MLLDDSVILVYVVVVTPGGTPAVAIGPMDAIPGLAVLGTAIVSVHFSDPQHGRYDQYAGESYRRTVRSRCNWGGVGERVRSRSIISAIVIGLDMNIVDGRVLRPTCKTSR